jgi:streptogramin lyase
VGKLTLFSVRGSPGAIVAGPDGNVWFTEDVPPAIGRISPRGRITEFSAGLDVGSEPTAIVAGPDGNLWFTEGGRPAAIGRITPGGTITEFSAGLNARSEPESIVLGPDGNLWFTDDGVTDLRIPAIGRITPSGTITEFSAGLRAQSSPGWIVAGPDGNLWFTDPDVRSEPPLPAIGRITPSGTITEFSAGLSSGSRLHASPDSIVAGPDGNVWFTEWVRPAIGRITPSGTITEFSAGLNGSPESIVVGPDGNLWFTEEGRLPAIGRITPSGTITEFSACLHTGRLGNALSITRGPDGNLWFTNNTRSIGAGVGVGLGPPSAIGRITPSGKITEFSAGLQFFSRPLAIVAGPDGNLWFTDFDESAIGRISPSTAPANAFITRRARRNTENGIAILPVVVPGPGRLALRGNGVVPRRPIARACGTVRLPIRTKGRAKERLNESGRVKLRVRITFTPRGGSPYRVAELIALRKRLHR